MSDPGPSRRRPRTVGALLSATVLITCAAGGFLVYRLAHPARTTLREAPVAPLMPAAAVQRPEVAPPAPRTIPETLPDFTLPGLDGTPHRLSDWKGHSLLVNFWASWCEPCRREIPLLESLRRERTQDGLEILGIALDFRDAAQQYAHTARIDYPVLIGEQGGYEAAAAFGMDAVLPFSVFADRTGRIVAVKVGELHRDEAGFILDRVRDLEAGRLTLPAARDQIASGIDRLNLRRAGEAHAAAH